MKVPGVLRRVVHEVGVDFGSSGVKVVALAQEAGGTSLLGADREPVDAGVIADGVVRNPDSVGAALGRVLARIGIRAASLSVAMGGSSVFVKRLPAPVAPPDEATPFREAVVEEAARHLPFHIESVEYDYEQDRGVGGDDDGTPPGVVFGAAPKDIVRSHCDAVHRAGYRVGRIDLEPYALFAAARLDAIAPRPAAPVHLPSGAAFIEIGARRIGVHLFRHGPGKPAVADEENGFRAAIARTPEVGQLLASVAVPGIGAEAALAATGASGADGGSPLDGGPESGISAATVTFRTVAALQEALHEAGLKPPVTVRLSGGGAGLPGIAAAVGRFASGPPAPLAPLSGLSAEAPGPAFAIAAGLAFQQLPEPSTAMGGAE